MAKSFRDRSSGEYLLMLTKLPNSRVKGLNLNNGSVGSSEPSGTLRAFEVAERADGSRLIEPPSRVEPLVTPGRPAPAPQEEPAPAYHVIAR